MAFDDEEMVSSKGIRWGNWVLLLLILAGVGGITCAWLILPDQYTAKPIFDSLGMIREAGILIFKDLRTRSGVRRENVVP